MKKVFLALFAVLLCCKLNAQTVFSPTVGDGCFTYEQVPARVDTVREEVQVVTGYTQTTQSVVVGYVSQQTPVLVREGYTNQVLQCTGGQMKICTDKVHPLCNTMTTYQPKYQDISVLVPRYGTITKKTIRVTPAYVRQVPCSTYTR